jgi:uncharacterized membrane protein
MTKYFAAYAATAAVMIVIDLIWLGVIAKPLYRDGIGHLMSDSPNIPAAVLFYLMFPVGLMIFAVAPNAASPEWMKTLIAGALFGFFTYATYDLTNLATLKGWPIGLAALDTAWGTMVSAASAAAGKWAFGCFAAS